MSSKNAIVSKMNKTCDADHLFLTSVLFVICRFFWGGMLDCHMTIQTNQILQLQVQIIQYHK